MAIMKKLIAFLLVVGFLMVAVQARYPAPGDYVQINCAKANSWHSYEGTITDIKDGLICLNCTYASILINDKPYHANLEYPYDVCIGSDSVDNLYWVED